MGNERWEKLDRLEAAITRARAARGAALDELEPAADELRAALDAAPRGATRDRGEPLWAELAGRVRELRDAMLRDRLTACARCAGHELLIAERLALALAGPGPDLPVGVAVCARCGDVRMWCEDLEAARGRMRLLEVTSDRRGPFR